MAFRLPRLRDDRALVVPQTGKPNSTFIQWWQSVVEKIEGVVADLTEMITRITTVEVDVSALEAVAFTAGNGLTGGGNILTNPAFAVGAGTGLTVNADDVAITATGVAAGAYGSNASVGTFTVNAQGQLTLAANVAISPTAIGALVPADIGVTVQGYDGDLAAIAAIAGTTGLLRKTAINAWSLDTAAYLTANQTITYTGDVTGSGTTAVTLTIANSAVTLTKMADVATATVFYRKTAGTGAPEVQTLATLKTDLGLTGTNSGDQTITLTGDVTGSGSGSFAATIAADAVTNAKLANVATATFKGRTTAGTGDPEDLTATQATALLNAATTLLQGVMSAADKTKLDAVASGTYTPTITNVVNTTAWTPDTADYHRIGDQVTVSGFVSVTASGAGVSAVNISLPIASNFTTTNQANGAGSLNVTADGNVSIRSNSTADTAQANFLAPAAGTYDISYIFQYRVI